MSEQYTAEMAHAAAAKGAAWLDEKCPDWVSHIDLKQLDLGSERLCILGQTAECLMGPPKVDGYRGLGYPRVLRHFGRDRDVWAERRGFVSFFARGDYVGFEMLDIAWRELIRQRLEAPA